MSVIFDNLFDFNGDGKNDCAEQAMEFMLLDELLNDEERPKGDIFDDDLDDGDDW